MNGGIILQENPSWATNWRRVASYRNLTTPNATLNDIKESGGMKRSKCKVKTSCKGNHTKNTCLDCKRPVCGKCGSIEVRCTDKKIIL